MGRRVTEGGEGINEKVPSMRVRAPPPMGRLFDGGGGGLLLDGAAPAQALAQTARGAARGLPRRDPVGAATDRRLHAARSRRRQDAAMRAEAFLQRGVLRELGGESETAVTDYTRGHQARSDQRARPLQPRQRLRPARQVRPRHRRLQRGDQARSQGARLLQQPRPGLRSQGPARPGNRRLHRGEPARWRAARGRSTTAGSPTPTRATTGAPSPTSTRRSSYRPTTPTSMSRAGRRTRSSARRARRQGRLHQGAGGRPGQRGRPRGHQPARRRGPLDGLGAGPPRP